MGTRDPKDNAPLDPRLEGELLLRLKRIERDTNAGWQDVGFFQWVWDRLTLSARRRGDKPTKPSRRLRP